MMRFASANGSSGGMFMAAKSTKKRSGVKLPSEKEIRWLDDIRKSHAADIGHIALAWSSLHVQLGEIFAEIMDPEGRSLGLAAWNAVPNDRSKRAMVLAVALQKFGQKKSKFVEELQWALGRANSLENNRNDAVHAPYAVTMDPEEGFKFVPYIWSGDSRAKSLQGRDLKAEFGSYIKNIGSLTSFVRDLGRMLSSPVPDPTWPERPALPRPAQAMARKS